jgi:hypothetical protein
MRRILILSIVMIGCLAMAYDQIIPVVAKASGGYGSQWQSDLTLYNAGKKAVDVTLSFLPSGAAVSPVDRSVTLGPGGLFDQSDILGWFGQQGSGSLTITCGDEARTALGAVSRTYAVTETGTFGQAVPAVPAALVPTGKAELSLGAAAVTWQYLAADGTVLGEAAKAYSGPMLEQYNQGAKSFFGSDADGRIVKAVLESGQALIYGSRIDNGTNDGSFMEAQPLKSNQAPLFLGVDAANDGSLDFTDADGDNVLDSPIPCSTSFLFNYAFTIVAQDPEGDPITFTLKNPPTGMTLTSSGNGSVYYAPSRQDINKTVQLQVDISDGYSVTAVILPLKITP